MPTEKPLAKTWAVLFPLFGLDVTDKAQDVSSPLLANSNWTVVSTAQLPAELGMWSTRWSYGGMHAEGTELRELCPSAIAVRCKGFLPATDADQSRLMKNARDRAYKVAALLSITLFAENVKPRTCGLAEQMPSIPYLGTTPNESLAIYVASQPVSWGGWGARIKAETVQLSKAELLHKLLAGRCGALTTVLSQANGSRGCGLDSTHIEAIASSALILSDAMHSFRTATQLSTSVTALELLLTTDRQDRFGNLKRRLVALIGKQACDEYEVEGILDRRHEFVHEGEHSGISHIASLKAIGLVIAVLTRYAEAAMKLPNQQALLSYLDYISGADKMRGLWSQPAQSAFESTILHTREGLYYDWQHGAYSLSHRLFS